jgi:PAS domain S-box-containing protein
MDTKPSPEESGKRVKPRMNFNRDKVAAQGDKSPATPWLMYMLIGMVGLVVSGILGYGIYISYRMNSMYAPSVDAIMGIKLEATSAHLWFEEFISGDPHKEMETVRKHLKQADWYAKAMLDGSESSEGTFLPLDNTEMRREIRAVQGKLSEFRDMTRKRLAAKTISGPDSDIDQLHDAIFSDFINKADDIEIKLRQIIAQYLRRFQFSYTAIIMIYILLTMVIAAAFHRFDRRRANDFLALKNMNQVLQKEITQRRQAEEALRETQEHFELAVQGSADGLWDWPDFNKDEEWWSPRWYELLGYTAGEVKASYTQFKSFLHPDDLDRVFEAVHAHFEKRVPYNIELRLRTKSGEYRWYRERGQALWDESGNPLRMSGSLQDINDQKHSEEALRESEELHRLTLSTISDAVFITDNAGVFTYICPNVDVIFSYSYQEVDTLKYISKLLGDDLCDLNDLDRLGEIKNIERQITDKKGAIHHLLVNVKRVSIKDGTVLYTCRDVSERKQAEEMVRSERDKLRGVLNAIGEELYIVDHDCTLEYQNEILINSFGNRQGQKCYRTFYQSNEPCGFCIMPKVIESNQMQGTEASFPDGSHYDIIFSPFMDVDGNIKAIVLSRDITEKKKLQAEAMHTGHLASLGELAAGVAHEINNPINGIISYGEILKDQFEAQSEDVEIPNRIIREGERIAQIVRNLLSFARERNEEPGPAQVQDILADALELVESQIKKDGIKLSLDVPSDLPKIKVRSQEIQQVFINILSNARHALNQRFPGLNKDKFLEIKAEAIEIGGRMHVRTSFYDGGMGIPRNIMDKISNPFFSTKPQGEGTGLGLSISHGIIKSHGGRIWFQSIEGRYTKVMVDLCV